MATMNELLAYKANPVDLTNYQTLKAPLDPNQQLRVDRKGKFYVLTQASSGVAKVLDAVRNFFIKLLNEGRGADQTHPARLAAATSRAVLSSLVKSQSLIDQKLTSCFGIVKEQQVEKLNAAREAAQKLLQEIPSARVACPNSGNILDALELAATQDLAVVDLLPKHESYPNQLGRDVKRLMADVRVSREYAETQIEERKFLDVFIPLKTKLDAIRHEIERIPEMTGHQRAKQRIYNIEPQANKEEIVARMDAQCAAINTIIREELPGKEDSFPKYCNEFREISQKLILLLVAAQSISADVQMSEKDIPLADLPAIIERHRVSA